MVNKFTFKSILIVISSPSGAGKTSIGKLFYNKIKLEQPNTIFLDGDELRLTLDIKESFSMGNQGESAQSKACEADHLQRHINLHQKH